jgi:hypothetical protein
MTEEEWLTGTDIYTILKYLQGRRVTASCGCSPSPAVSDLTTTLPMNATEGQCN